MGEVVGERQRQRAGRGEGDRRRLDGGGAAVDVEVARRGPRLAAGHQVVGAGDRGGELLDAAGVGRLGNARAPTGRWSPCRCALGLTVHPLAVSKSSKKTVTGGGGGVPPATTLPVTTSAKGCGPFGTLKERTVTV